MEEQFAVTGTHPEYGEFRVSFNADTIDAALESVVYIFQHAASIISGVVNEWEGDELD